MSADNHDGFHGGNDLVKRLGQSALSTSRFVTHGSCPAFRRPKPWFGLVVLCFGACVASLRSGCHWLIPWFCSIGDRCALSDNSEPGHVHFIDPSFVDDFWKQDAQVQEYFGGFGITNVTHHLMTTQRFVESATYREFQEIGLVFIDGYHSAEQAQFDFESFAPKLAPQGIILLHDSLWGTRSKIYGPGREYTHSVMNFVAKLRHLAEWQVFDFPFGDGVTLVRGATVPLLAERMQ